MVMLIIDVMGCIVLAAGTLTTKAKFQEIFNDLGVTLPQITMFLVSVPSAIYLLFFAGLIIALLLKEKYIQNKPLTFTINMLVAVGVWAYLSVYVIAMFLALTQAIHNVK